MLPIAFQLYSVRDELEKDFEGTLRAVAALGYEGVEFAGLYGHEPQEIKGLLKKYGLTAVSAHVPYAQMSENPGETLAAYAEIGCSFIAIPYMTEEHRYGAPAYGEVVENIKSIGEKCNTLGMTLLYHNHDFELMPVEGKLPLDILYEDVPASLLQTEIDTCWVKVAGFDPAAYVRGYKGRAPVVHLKDFYMTGSAAGTPYELIGIEKEADNNGGFEFRPVGMGIQSFYDIYAASVEAGAQWVVVEQDAPSLGKTPLECAGLSIKYLKDFIIVK